MTYEATINFTLDTIYPWTYIAKKRLDKALEEVRAKNPPVTFTLRLHPFQLHPSLPATGTSKHAWYESEIHHSSATAMSAYKTAMSSLGAREAISFDFSGTTANTLNAHRVLQLLQDTHGAARAEACLMALYRMYFEEAQHPSSSETLGRALEEAGVERGEAEGWVGDEEVGLREVKGRIREQASNGVDAVPYLVFEGRKRDFTLEGAREVGEYVRVLEQVVREAV